MPVLAGPHLLQDSLTVAEAKLVIRRHQQSAPVNVSTIAEDLGLRIYASPLEPGISGKIFRDPNSAASSGFVIHVNRAELFIRQRFTAAHEIAHFILHRHLVGDGLSDDVLYRSKLSSSVETEANNLAADMLMPWHLVNALTGEGVTEISALAERFEVSPTAMSIRLGMPT